MKIYVCIYTCVHIYMYVCMYMYICMRVYIYYIYICVYMYIRTWYLHIHINIRYLNVCTHVHIHAFVYISTHSCTSNKGMSLIVRHCSTWYIFTSPSPPHTHPPAPPHTHTHAKQELACGKYVAESEHTYVCAKFLSSTWHSYSHPPSLSPPPQPPTPNKTTHS